MLPVLSCGGYVNLLQDIVMWFSSGGTKSVLHSDNVDNINCLFSGEKELYMVDKVPFVHLWFSDKLSLLCNLLFLVGKLSNYWFFSPSIDFLLYDMQLL